MKKKKQKIQIFLIFVGFFLIFSTYIYYPYSKRINLEKNQAEQNKRVIEKTDTSEGSTFFQNVEYLGFYNLNKPIKIKSEEAYMLDEESDILYMKKMTVIINLDDGRLVTITSDEGRYNKSTYDCFFEKNVVAKDGEIKITAENLNLLATENVVKIYNKVNLNHPTGSLNADNIDYDFETKYFKVTMFDDKAIKMKVLK